MGFTDDDPKSKWNVTITNPSLSFDKQGLSSSFNVNIATILPTPNVYPPFLNLWGDFIQTYILVGYYIYEGSSLPNNAFNLTLDNNCTL